ncbi:hypothetical protein BH11GEM1_BH11GEM1_02290 [soil metagenome]
MKTIRIPGLFALAMTLGGCAGESTTTAPSRLSATAPSYGRTVTVSDPTATFKFPLADAGLSLKSDGLYSDGTSSVYANGVCGTSAKIFATPAASNSGDATLQTTGPKGRNCGRVVTLHYSDGVSETIPVFMNVNKIENTTYSIAVGSTVTRRLGINPVQATRCDFLTFGTRSDGAGAGSDSVLVTRLDASSWHVQSQPNGADLAYCSTTGQLYHMPVDFTIVSSRALP